MKKLFENEHKLEKMYSDKKDLGGVAGMTKTIDPERIISIIKDNKNLIRKIRGRSNDDEGASKVSNINSRYKRYRQSEDRKEATK